MANKSNKNSGTEILRPRARILRTLGDELISSETVAVIELVKNSYDADATKVVVRFIEPLELNKGSIEIIDNGHGMSLDTIRSAWMEPATHHKKSQRFSEIFKRRLLGEKGIGRFAASRLANELEVITRRKESNKETIAVFDWKQFDDESKYLDQVEVLWEEKEPSEIHIDGTISRLHKNDSSLEDFTLSGTVLKMDGLRINWDLKQLITLRDGLSKLVSPFFNTNQNSAVNDFEIFLELPEKFQHLSGAVLPPDTFKNPHYSVRGFVNDSGKCRLKLKLGEKEEYLRSQLVISKKENYKPKCGPFFVDFRVWDRDTGSLRELAEEKNSTLKDIRSDLDNAAGISIYRDKFRVLPYGEPKNDWLRLDIRRVQNPTLRISNNQIVGYIVISADRNPLLIDQSNREGLMEGEALEDLRSLIIAILAELESRRYVYKRISDAESSPVPKTQSGLFTDFNLNSVRELVQKNHPNDRELIEAVNQKEIDIEQKVEVVQEVLGRYRRLSTIGQLVDTILHDSRTPLAKVVNESDIALKKIANGTLDTTEQVEKRFIKIKGQAGLISDVFQKIEPLSGRKAGKPERIQIKKIIEDSFYIFNEEIKEKNIKVRLPYRETEARVVASEIQQIILNLLQNSIYWLNTVSGNDKQIYVDVNRNSQNQIEIIFSDNGPGIPDYLYERVFDPYFSTKPNGIGLGLSIVGEIIQENYNGKLELIDAGPLPGTTFRITLNNRG